MQFVFHQSCFTQAVKVKVVYVELWRFVEFAERECRAADDVTACSTASNTAGQRGFAAAEITDKFNDFTAPQPLAELLAEALGSVGVG